MKYDPDNLDRVLAVNDDGTLRFMLERKYVQPMALADRKEGDAGELARINRFNEELERDIGTRLSHAYEKVEQLFGDHPQLDVATRLLLCDSLGRNKAHKRTSRSAPPGGGRGEYFQPVLTTLKEYDIEKWEQKQQKQPETEKDRSEACMHDTHGLLWRPAFTDACTAFCATRRRTPSCWPLPAMPVAARARLSEGVPVAQLYFLVIL